MVKNPHQFLQALKKKPEHFWMKRGEAHALKLFHAAAVRIPAYKDFLKQKKIRAEKIKMIADFRHVPPVDKDNYLRRYPLKAVCWDGNLNEKRWTFAQTSGSTGKPFYFPREQMQDRQYAFTAELYLLNQFEIDKKSTLYIDGFAMGAWIGGLFTYEAIRLLAERSQYPLSIITPGLNKKEILNAVQELGPQFDQIIIGGYPPFIKDVIDEGLALGIPWKNLNIRFIFSAEGFNELFRDYIAKKTGLKNIYRDSLNHYGTVDLGTMSHETPLSILMRRLALKNTSLYSMLFGATYKLPTLTQFLPEMFFFEEVDGNLFCSAASGIPLVRYDLHDHGGIFSFDDLYKKFATRGIDLKKEAAQAEIEDTIWNLPFVHVYERNDLSVSLYGGNVYPETIRNVLQTYEFERHLTGKFTMLIQTDAAQNPYLAIHTELKPGAREFRSLKNIMVKKIVDRLLQENSEYRVLHQQLGEKKLIPHVVFWPHEHSLYFRSGGKQKWVSK